MGLVAIMYLCVYQLKKKETINLKRSKGAHGRAGERTGKWDSAIVTLYKKLFK